MPNEMIGPIIGSKWMEKDKRVVIPAEVLGYDANWVYIRRVRRTRVSMKRFMEHFVLKSTP